MNRNIIVGKLLAYIGIPVVLSAVILRFALFLFKSDGLSGMSLMYPLLAIGILMFALLMSFFFAAWVYQDCKKRNDDGVLWAIIVLVTTPFIGLLLYFLRRSEVKKNCASCGHPVSLKAKYCEECGSKIEIKEDFTAMEIRRTHHISFLIMGIICMVLMLTCLTGFIVSAASGSGINSNAASNEKVWNLGVISKNYENHSNGVWKLDFKSASNGFIAEEKMTVNNAKSDCLYAEVVCGTVPEGAALTLYLVQNDTVKTYDVTNLSEPLVCSLADFENGEIYVRLLIEGVGDTVSVIYIK